MDSNQATEEEVSEQALCRTCGSDEGGGKSRAPTATTTPRNRAAPAAGSARSPARTAEPYSTVSV